MALAGAGPGVVEAQNQEAGPGEADYVDVRVWQHVSDPSLLFISARPAGSRWGAFRTVRLPLDDGRSRDGNHRFGDITLPAGRTPRGLQPRPVQGRQRQRPRHVHGGSGCHGPVWPLRLASAAFLARLATVTAPAPRAAAEIQVGSRARIPDTDSVRFRVEGRWLPSGVHLRRSRHSL